MKNIIFMQDIDVKRKKQKVNVTTVDDKNGVGANQEA